MRFAITNIDGPQQLAEKAPLIVELVREVPGPDRSDYWLGTLGTPIIVVMDNHDRTITHLILAARWEGTAIASGAVHLPLGIAYVTDQSLLSDSKLDFGKCHYVALGVGSDVSDGRPAEPLRKLLAGTIGRAFGLGYRRAK
jgi:hypothetical protein